MKIKDNYENPDWLDSKKYVKTKNLDAKQWYHQLLFRKMIINNITKKSNIDKMVDEIKIGQIKLDQMVKADKIVLKEKPQEISPQQLKEQHLKTFDNWIKRDFEKIQLYGVIPEEIFGRLELKNSFTSKTIKPITKLEALALREIIINSENEVKLHEILLAKSISSEKDIIDKGIAKEYGDFKSSPFVHNDQAYFVVDLKASDEQILNDLEKMLRVLRGIKNTKNKKIQRGKYDILKFSEYNILPYIDLILWSSIKDMTLKRTHISDIFLKHLNHHIDSEFLRKTLEPLCNQILNSNFLNILCVDAIQNL